ncbi:MFS transporter [Cuneatibacter sp. NSJ-177]|uniref:MFS transporter n=1 Tax=Cuneatibacter sp. NSJ-177 TaxID=2931401 RepID=UPI001FD4C7DF|nr:MFS transporter [Cuneatibacter sp. NSJ-177]MCJ7835642.1 MFS transporter [Cuneatibacter sp. NSJ-177]
MNKKRIHFAWLILLGVILIRGFAGGGINMTSGLFLSPVSEEIGVGIGSLSIYFSITSIVMVLFLPLAGRIINRLDIRLTALLGAALQALSFAAFGLLHHVAGWYLLSIPHAMGAALLVNLMGPILINRWFARKAGTMMGIQMAFVGLFGAVLQPLTSRIIHQSGWRNAYFFIGGLTFLAVVLTAFFLLRNRPSDLGIEPYGADRLDPPQASKNAEEAVEIPESTALHSASFYLLLLFMIAITGVGVFTQHIPTYGTAMGYSVSSTGTALAFASVGSAIGSIAIGVVSDKIGGLLTCYGMIGIGIAEIIGFWFSPRSFLLFTASTFLHGLVSSGIMVLAPILTIKFFGQKDYEKIFAKVSMGAPLASILLIPAYGFVYDWRKDYSLVLLLMLGMLIAAAFCIAVGWRKRCTAEGCPRWRE